MMRAACVALVLALAGAAADWWTTRRALARGMREVGLGGSRIPPWARAVLAVAVAVGLYAIDETLWLVAYAVALWTVAALNARKLGLLLLLLLAAPLARAQEWPAPCADAGTCWLAWDPSPPAERVTCYEVVAADLLCARVCGGHADRQGRWHGPRSVYWPRPGDGCWEPGASREYQVLAVHDEGLRSEGRSNAVAFGPQEWTCVEAPGCERPCPVRRLPHLPECEP